MNKVLLIIGALFVGFTSLFVLYRAAWVSSAPEQIVLYPDIEILDTTPQVLGSFQEVHR